jgi:hypothetical protein
MRGDYDLLTDVDGAPYGSFGVVQLPEVPVVRSGSGLPARPATGVSGLGLGADDGSSTCPV